MHEMRLVRPPQHPYSPPKLTWKLTWMDRAACKAADPEVFFEKAMYPLALALCRSCPVMDECRAWTDRIEGRSRNYEELFGVFGGETVDDRIRRRAEELERVA